MERRLDPGNGSIREAVAEALATLQLEGEVEHMAGKKGHRGFGSIRKLPSKRFQASYVGPDGVRHLAGTTFVTKLDAEGWLAVESRLVASGDWRSPAARRTAQAAARVTLRDYAEIWLRQRSLKPRTVALYRDLLERRILPPLGRHQVGQLTPAVVRDWYSTLDESKPRVRAHAYALLRTICTTAVDDELLPANPCRIRGAGQAKRRARPNRQPSTNWPSSSRRCRPGCSSWCCWPPGAPCVTGSSPSYDDTTSTWTRV